MKNEILIARILKDAETIKKMHDEMNESFKKRKRNPEAWELESESFHFFYDSLAFPGGLEQSMLLLEKQDLPTIDIAIAYLQADPYCFRSGDVKKTITRLLKQAPLTQEQVTQMQDILMHAITTNSGKEYRDYCALAPKVGDDAFYARIEEVMRESSDLQVIERAQRMLDALLLQ